MYNILQIQIRNKNDVLQIDNLTFKYMKII